ncbi:hypothetical protein EX895_004955 [Sporisorium graminicola]|uniref:Uncharacterized protein n=1 Tax=Sporisorium graminicola TaxID=280036 RepID=A0A4U7KP36_9BASI|nr:hypothetical protein EX895_004955 [Sporisorium graminicola]TKY86130.1 hypothetical protein EX895_004955 [Sporisorium graminicola]
MSSEAQFEPEGHNTDEQNVIEQERVDEERETSFLFQKEARDAELDAPAAAAAEEQNIGTDDARVQPLIKEPATQNDGEEEEAEAAAVEEATATEAEAEAVSPSKPARSSRKSRASGSDPNAAEVEAEPSRKKARKSVATTSTTVPASAPEADANVRIDRLRQALFRFLDLIEHRATASSFAKALPHIDAESVEALRQQFVSQLKEAIIDESEKLIESNDLEAKLASLHRLAQEADARYQAGYQEGAEEIKDIWRKEMDLETAISARAIPDQERRVDQLKAELEQVRKQNQAIHAALLDTRARSDAIQSDARDSLDALESAIKGLEATPDMQKQLRQTMDDLLQDLGARV